MAKQTKRPARMPAYLREDLPQVKWIYRPKESHFLLSGKEMYEFLEEDRIPKDKRFPRRRRRRRGRKKRTLLKQVLAMKDASNKHEDKQGEGANASKKDPVQGKLDESRQSCTVELVQRQVPRFKDSAAHWVAPLTFPGLGSFKAALPEDGSCLTRNARVVLGSHHPLAASFDSNQSKGHPFGPKKVPCPPAKPSKSSTSAGRPVKKWIKGEVVKAKDVIQRSTLIDAPGNNQTSNDTLPDSTRMMERSFTWETDGSSQNLQTNNAHQEHVPTGPEDVNPSAVVNSMHHNNHKQPRMLYSSEDGSLDESFYTCGSTQSGTRKSSARSPRKHRKTILRGLREMETDVPMGSLDSIFRGVERAPLTRVEKNLSHKMEVKRHDYNWYAETSKIVAELEEKEMMQAAEREAARKHIYLKKPVMKTREDLVKECVEQGQRTMQRMDSANARKISLYFAQKALLKSNIHRRQMMYEKGYADQFKIPVNHTHVLWLMAIRIGSWVEFAQKRYRKHPRAKGTTIDRVLAAREAEKKVLSYYYRRQATETDRQNALAVLAPYLSGFVLSFRIRKRHRSADIIRLTLGYKNRIQNRCIEAFMQVRDSCVRFQNNWRSFLVVKKARVKVLRKLWDRGSVLHARRQRQKVFSEKNSSTHPSSDSNRSFHVQKPKKAIVDRFIQEIYQERRKWYRESLRNYFKKECKTRKILPFGVHHAQKLIKGKESLVQPEIVDVVEIPKPQFLLYSRISIEEMANHVAAAIEESAGGVTLKVPGLPPNQQKRFSLTRAAPSVRPSKYNERGKNR